jgi:hypothetical protein
LLLDVPADQFTAFGSVTTGNKAGSWVILPPGYTKTLPSKFAGLPRTTAPTLGVWVLGRMYVANQQDLPNVLKLWSQFKIEPVNAGDSKPTLLYSTANKAFSLMGKPGPADIGKANSTAAFVALAGLLKTLPPPKQQLANLTKAARAVNLDLLRGFDQPRVSPAQAAVYTAGYQLSFSCIEGFLASGALGKSFKYGWTVSVQPTRYRCRCRCTCRCRCMAGRHPG